MEFYKKYLIVKPNGSKRTNNVVHTVSINNNIFQCACHFTKHNYSKNLIFLSKYLVPLIILGLQNTTCSNKFSKSSVKKSAFSQCTNKNSSVSGNQTFLLKL